MHPVKYPFLGLWANNPLFESHRQRRWLTLFELAGHTSLQTTQRYIEGDTEAKRKLVQLVFYSYELY